MWACLKLETAGESADVLAERLDELGALAVTIQAADDEERFAGPDDAAQMWNNTSVCAWFDADRKLAPVVEALSLLPVRQAGVDYVADRDWVRVTRDASGPLQITDGLWIVPSWNDAPQSEAVNLVIDPGLAFGTGRHPTTQLTLRWLAAQNLNNCRVLDYGCGSGILAIAALLLGAERAVGVDIDPGALAVAAGNAAANGVGDSVEFRTVGEEDDCDYDVIVANILLRPLLDLIERFASLQAVGGRLALAGITADQQDAMEAALSLAGYRVNAVERQEEWILLTALRQ